MALVQNQQYLLTVGRRFTHQGVYDSVNLLKAQLVLGWSPSKITDVGSIDYVIHSAWKSPPYPQLEVLTNQR